MSTPASMSMADFADRSFFLSETNWTATADQRDLETRAIELLDHPAIVEATGVATMRFNVLAGDRVPPEARTGMAERMREWAMHYVLLGLNSDPNYPKVVGHILAPPHEWFGMKVPGTRGPGTGENADNNYSIIPVDPVSRFELIGKIGEPKVGDCPIHVSGAISGSQNVAHLDWRDVVIDADGTFVITIGPEPADGRPNHLQTAPDARILFIRDGRQTWAQQPNAYRIRRLDPPTAPPADIETLVQVAARYIVEDVPTNWWYREMVAFVEANTLTEVLSSGPVGGMATQVLLRGRVVVEPDEAYVLTIGAGGADYWNVSSYDWWMMSGDLGNRTTSLNDTQSAANPDGSYSYVFSIADPGVQNWIDTEGRRETTFMTRWQLLPKGEGGSGEKPWATGDLVKLADLKEVLPEGTAWVSDTERAQQLTDRVAEYRKRYEV